MKLLVLISLILPHRRGEGGGQLGLEEAQVGGVLGAVGIFSRRTKALRGGAHPGALCGIPDWPNKSSGGERESYDNNTCQVLDITVAKSNKVSTIIKLTFQMGKLGTETLENLP